MVLLELLYTFGLAASRCRNLGTTLGEILSAEIDFMPAAITSWPNCNKEPVFSQEVKLPMYSHP